MSYSTPTQADIARLAGVSRGLVSLALSDSPRVNAKTKQQILQIANELGYTRNLHAADLAGNKSTLLGILFPSMHNPVFASLIDAIQTEAERHGLLAIQATTGGILDREQKMLRKFQQLRVLGVINLSPSLSSMQLREYAKLVPLTVVGTNRIGGLVDAVHTDELQAARLVAEHARERGYTCTAQITLPEDVEPAIRIRREAYSTASREYGFSPIIELPLPSTRDAVERILSGTQPHKTLIATHNDLIALDVASSLRGLGITPGENVGIVGFDDTILVQREEFNITSVDQQPQFLGSRAVQLIQERASNRDRPAQNVIASPTLSVRGSS